ncbi:MAG: hypothetical protein ACLTL6_05155 [Holdemanella porci]
MELELLKKDEAFEKIYLASLPKAKKNLSYKKTKDKRLFANTIIT